MRDPDRIAKAASSKTYRKANNKIASALEIEPSHTRSAREDFDLNVKRISYQKKLLDMHDEQTKAAGKPVRRPRLDKTRRRKPPI